ncbi:DUF397 domain-containing protein [Lentzea sp. BCCO 10_0798]|uniref:DUF397 domain-containing protein n=1 Tax=Lentzea kristufekii TaxID=3095430 RepID=A0ABU4TQ89_9PSEU|nr:DUF397 domain-containing protein [Lentzea sp. BCCO 10_0798]MDX8050387.1 DUF397 domain-containing protein [Lentzea sp. BCCO 10_0798]
MKKDRRWRKSSRSNSGQECIEVANDVDAVRDSKNPTTLLEFGPLAMSMFIEAAKAGTVGR